MLFAFYKPTQLKQLDTVSHFPWTCFVGLGDYSSVIQWTAMHGVCNSHHRRFSVEVLGLRLSKYICIIPLLGIFYWFPFLRRKTVHDRTCAMRQARLPTTGVWKRCTTAHLPYLPLTHLQWLPPLHNTSHTDKAGAEPRMAFRM